MGSQIRDVRRSYTIYGTLALLAAVFALTLPVNHTQGEDALRYVLDVETGWSAPSALFHPNHLLYGWVSYCFYRLWQALGYASGAAVPMQVLSLLASIATLGIVARLALSWSLTASSTVLLLFAIAGCQGYWFYSVEAETYVLPLPFMLMALAKASTAETVREHAGTAIWASLATIFHQQHSLLMVALGVFFLWRQGGLKRPVLIYGLTATVLVGSAYFLVSLAILGHQSIAETLIWAKGRAQDGLWTPWAWSAPIKSVVGAAQAIWGLAFLFGFESVAATTAAIFPGKLMVEEAFLAQHLSPAVKIVCLLALALSAIGIGVIVALLTFGLLSRGRHLDDLPPNQRNWLWLSGLIVVIYAVFNTVWEPTNPEFWLALLPVIILSLFLIGHTVLAARRLGREQVAGLAAVVVVSLWVVNGLGSMIPFRDAESDYWFHATRPLSAAAESGDLVLTRAGYVGTLYLQSITRARVIDTGREPASEILPLLVPGRTLWLSSWVFDLPAELAKPLAQQTRRKVEDPAQELLLQTLRLWAENADALKPTPIIPALQQTVWRIVIPDGTPPAVMPSSEKHDR